MLKLQTRIGPFTAPPPPFQYYWDTEKYLFLFLFKEQNTYSFVSQFSMIYFITLFMRIENVDILLPR